MRHETFVKFCLANDEILKHNGAVILDMPSYLYISVPGDVYNMSTTGVCRRFCHGSTAILKKTMLGRAIAIAAEAHKGQVDKAGKPYIWHCIRVMNRFDYEVAVPIAAVLHDTLEDTTLTYDDIRSTFGATVADTVQTLTRRDGEEYMDYIQRVKGDPMAARIKLADLRDNMDTSRLSEVTNGDLRRQIRYAKAQQFLLDI